jgi:hypothetical protein
VPKIPDVLGAAQEIFSGESNNENDLREEEN